MCVLWEFGAVVKSEGGAVVKGRNWERGGNAGAEEEGWKNEGRVVCGIRFGLALGADDRKLLGKFESGFV